MYLFIFLGTRGGDEGYSGLFEAGGVGVQLQIFKNKKYANGKTFNVNKQENMLSRRSI